MKEPPFKPRFSKKSEKVQCVLCSKTWLIYNKFRVIIHYRDDHQTNLMFVSEEDVRAMVFEQKSLPIYTDARIKKEMIDFHSNEKPKKREPLEYSPMKDWYKKESKEKRTIPKGILNVSLDPKKWGDLTPGQQLAFEAEYKNLFQAIGEIATIIEEQVVKPFDQLVTQIGQFYEKMKDLKE